jgi:hypothetical protein
MVSDIISICMGKAKKQFIKMLGLATYLAVTEKVSK